MTAHPIAVEAVVDISLARPDAELLSETGHHPIFRLPEPGGKSQDAAVRMRSDASDGRSRYLCALCRISCRGAGTPSLGPRGGSFRGDDSRRPDRCLVRI